MNSDLLKFLCCPVCRGELALTGSAANESRIQNGALSCLSCTASYQISNGVPILIRPALKSHSEQDWLGQARQKPRLIRGDRLWYIFSNLLGLLFLPLLAVGGWAVDALVLIQRHKPPFSISDVRGLFWWHLKNRRPYQHLRMIEHALALAMIRDWSADCPRELTIVDIGAEKSLFCSYLARLGYRTIGLDLDRAQMQWQHRIAETAFGSRRAPLDFVVGSATELPFKDNSIFVTAISVIEHIEVDEQAFAEIGRVIGSGHRAVISFLHQNFPLGSGQKEAAWRRAREYHPAYGVPRDPEKFILAPSGCKVGREVFFWKRFNRRVKRWVRMTRIFDQSMLFDYFIYVRLARLEECRFPGKQANESGRRVHAWQWIFELRKS